MPETGRVLSQNKFGQLVLLVGYLKRKFITKQHGNRNVNVGVYSTGLNFK
jgi:hypothetical protein